MRTALLAGSLALAACGRLGFDARSRDDAGGDAAVDTLPACSAVGFSPAPSPMVAMGPRDLVLADLDGDGRLDAAAADETGTLSVLIGKGDGTFEPRVDYGSVMHNWSIAAGDLDGDGRPDLVLGDFDDAAASVYVNNGDGTFQSKVDYTTGTAPQSTALGDVNGDGRLDIVTANYGANTVSVLRGNGNGTFQARADYGTAAGPYSVAIGDVNQDGKPDLAVADQGGCGACTGNLVSVLLGNGDGTFQPKVDFPTGNATQPWHVAIADVNQDGKLDLEVANNFGAITSTQTISVLLGNGNGTFQTHQDVQADPYPWWVSVADFDGNGIPDLVVANGTSSSASLILGAGGGAFRPRMDFPAGAQPLSIAVGDLNGDGRPDVVTATATGATLAVLLMTCTP